MSWLVSKHVKHLTHVEMKYRFQRLICSAQKPLFNIRTGIYDRGKTVILKHCHYLDIEYYQRSKNKWTWHFRFIFKQRIEWNRGEIRVKYTVEENLCILFFFMMVFDIRKLFLFFFFREFYARFIPFSNLK